MSRVEITKEFKNAEKKGLIVYLNETTGDFEVCNNEGDILMSAYDELNNEGDASNNVAKEKVQEFIKEW